MTIYGFSLCLCIVKGVRRGGGRLSAELTLGSLSTLHFALEKSGLDFGLGATVIRSGGDGDTFNSKGSLYVATWREDIHP